MCALRFTPILYGHVHVLLFLRGKETFCLNNNKLKIYSLFFLSNVRFHLSITLLFSYISPFPPLCLLFYHSCSSAAALSNPSLISPRNLCHASSHSSVLLALLCSPFSSWSINKHPLLRMLMNLQLRKSEPVVICAEAFCSPLSLTQTHAAISCQFVLFEGHMTVKYVLNTNCMPIWLNKSDIIFF